MSSVAFKHYVEYLEQLLNFNVSNIWLIKNQGSITDVPISRLIISIMNGRRATGLQLLKGQDSKDFNKKILIISFIVNYTLITPPYFCNLTFKGDDRERGHF